MAIRRLDPKRPIIGTCAKCQGPGYLIYEVSKAVDSPAMSRVRYNVCSAACAQAFERKLYGQPALR